MASGDGQFDLRALQRVGDFTNDRAEWKRWSFVFRGYVGAASPRLLELMTRVTELQGEITYDALNEDDNALDNRLHYVLALVLKGHALGMLMNQEPGRGLACWRELVLLHEPRSAGHQRAKLVEILNGTNLSGTWRAKIAQWERLVKDYESQAVAPVDEEIKMAVFEKHICPDDVGDHLCLNAARLTTYDKMKDEVAGVLLARQGRSAASGDSSGPTPMDIGWIGWTGKGKGDKGKKGKGKGDKGKGDKGKKDVKTKHKSADKNADAKADKYEKRCYWCGRKGHFQSDCYFKKEYEKIKGGVNLVEGADAEGETLAVDWVLAIVSGRTETPIVDSGAVRSTCPPGFAPLVALDDVAGERPLRAANGHDLENFVSKVVQQEVKLASGKSTQVLTKYRAANVQRPIISLSEAVNGGNVGFFSKDFSGIARAGDVEILVKGDYIPLMQKGGLFEMGLLGATQGDPRRWAKSRGTELGVATVTDGGSVEVGNEFDKRLEKAFMKSVKDMETEREVSEEVIDAEAVEPAKRKVATTPSSPTDEEVARHNETHLPYCAWCKVCVQGKARQSGHKARPVEVTERTLVQVDYCHMTCDDIAGKPKLTIFVAVERRKRSSDEYIVKGFAAWLDALDSGPVIVRSDAEPAIGDVVKEAVSRREEKTELQLSPKRSKGALAAAEATNFAVESQVRTMRLGLLARYPSEKVSGENRLVAWMVRHCGWLLTRFQMKATGRTAYCSRMGREI